LVPRRFVHNNVTLWHAVTVKDTEAPSATAVKEPINGDVTYVLQAADNCDAGNVQIFVKDSAQGNCGGAFVAGPYAPGTRVKLALTKTRPTIKRGSDGIAANILTVGNPVLVVTDSSGNTSCTLVVLPAKK